MKLTPEDLQQKRRDELLEEDPRHVWDTVWDIKEQGGEAGLPEEIRVRVNAYLDRSSSATAPCRRWFTSAGALGREACAQGLPRVAARWVPPILTYGCDVRKFRVDAAIPRTAFASPSRSRSKQEAPHAGVRRSCCRLARHMEALP